MSTFKKHSILLLLCASLLAVSSVNAQEERSGKKSRKGPPLEALVACENLSLDNACSFTSKRHGEVEGTCIAPKNGDSLLACKPSRKPKK